MRGLDKEQVFDLWAATYDWLFPSVFYQAIHQRLLESIELPDPSKVLDLGCGTGRLLHRLARRSPHLQGIGLDFSEQMLHQAQLHNHYPSQLTYVRGSVESLPFNPEQFDAVFSSLSFLHYPQPQSVFLEIARVLRPGGHFYFIDPSPSRFCRGTVKVPVSPEGITLYSQEARSQMGRDAGLSCLAHHYLLASVLLTVFVKPRE